MANAGNRLRPMAAVLTITGTATGTSTGTIMYGSGGYQTFGLFHVTSGSTKNMSFRLQGSIGQSGGWTNMTGVTTGSTSGAFVNSTASIIVDRVRLMSTANLTTSTAHKLYVYVVPSVGGF